MGEATFFDFGDEDAELDAAGDFADFGFGAFGFLVGPALLDFLAFDGDFAFAAAGDAAFAADFLSPAGDFLDLEAAVVAALFFSAAVFFAFGEVFLAGLPLGLVFSAAAAARLVGEAFLARAAADFFFSAAGLAAPAAVLANLKDPEAPLPFVCTSAPEATDAFKYFLMNGATFSASTL